MTHTSNIICTYSRSEAEMNPFSKVDPQPIQSNDTSFASLFHLNTDAIFLIDVQGNIKTGNVAATKLSGFSLTEIKGKSYIELIDERDRKLSHECFSLSLQSIFKEYRLNIISKSGERIGCLVKFIPIQSDEKINDLFIVIKSMKDSDLIAAKYLESELNFQIIAENVQDVIILMNSHKEYLYVSPSSKKVFAFNPEKALKKESPFFNIHPDYINLLEEKFNHAIIHDEPFTIVLKAMHEERGWIWTELNGSPVYSTDHQFQHMVLVARDISIQKKQEDKLKQYAFHDSLTGLPNRRYFRKYINKSIERLNIENQAFAVIMLDIDDFKCINDQFGHEVGDQVICHFANRIENVVNANGVAARLGGDEFIILLNKVNTEELKQFIEKVQKNIVEYIIIKELKIKISTSIGATICTSKYEDYAYFLKRADIALYQVKEKGKNQYHINYS